MHHSAIFCFHANFNWFKEFEYFSSILDVSTGSNLLFKLTNFVNYIILKLKLCFNVILGRWENVKLFCFNLQKTLGLFSVSRFHFLGLLRTPVRRYASWLWLKSSHSPPFCRLRPWQRQWNEGLHRLKCIIRLRYPLIHSQSQHAFFIRPTNKKTANKHKL